MKMPKLGQILIEKYGLNPQALERALEIQKKVGGYLGQILLREGSIAEKHLLSALSLQLNIPVILREDIDGSTPNLPQEVLEQLNLEFLLKNKWLPYNFSEEDKTLHFLTLEPQNLTVVSLLKQKLPYNIKIYLTEEYLFNRLAKTITLPAEESYKTLDFEETIEKLKEIAHEAPVIKYLNQLLNRAVELHATDIHIEPYGGTFRVRFRVDGFLHTVDTLEKSLYLAIVSRIKLLAGLDIAEKRLPQDGKIALKIASILLDIRVSTIPMVDGESVVLRLLYKERLSFDITTLGLEKDHEVTLLKLITAPYGIILITGPTGSGKTTTLYSILTRLNQEVRKVVTVEDPVEYKLEGINQIQVKPEIGLTFAHALRSILRHDPDIIMIGEIRDRETAEIAIHSALTGHLVLSTLHTNDSPSALFRLIEMGIEDYLLNASIVGLLAQRIVRKICPHCATEEDPLKIFENTEFRDFHQRMKTFASDYDDSLAELLENPNFSRGSGCPKCLNTGYLGRIAIFEVMAYDDRLRECFIKEKSLEKIRELLRKEYHFRTLREDGFIKVIKGITTLEEVYRVT